MSPAHYATIGIAVAVIFALLKIIELKFRKDPKQELIEIKQLLDDGVIEQTEYAILKKKFLDQINDM